jgi:putative transposase
MGHQKIIFRCGPPAHTAIETRARLFGQKRYYDHNVRNYEGFVGKLRYIHRNPVKRGLAESPEDWKWSSFRHYATAEVEPVEIQSQWTAGLKQTSRCNHHFCLDRSSPN